ncbi:MAG TPA: pyridoxal phosphate-dependent aminotransferase [Vicinamibacteria bacterium]
MRLAQRIEAVGPNAILALAADCRRRQVMGQRVVDLGLGEPDTPTPAHIVAAAARAAADGHTRYTPPAGIGELRAAIVRGLAAEGLAYAPREVMVSCGAMGALGCAFLSLLEPGDEVLLPVPYYPSYLPQIGLAGGRPVAVPTDEASGFKLQPEALDRALTPRSRVLVLNAPSNPAGTVYTREELRALAAVALQAGLTIVSDEVYRDLRAGPEELVSVAALGLEARRHTLVVRSLSKSYAMTGWRIGYAAGPATLIQAMTRVQEALIVMPSSISQWAALEALTGPQDCVRELASSLEQRAAFVRQRLQAMPGVRCPPAGGTFFAFPALGAPGSDATALCAFLLDRHGVAVVPGREFGMPWCARVSCAAPRADLEEGLERMERGLVAGRHGHAA